MDGHLIRPSATSRERGKHQLMVWTVLPNRWLIILHHILVHSKDIDSWILGIIQINQRWNDMQLDLLSNKNACFLLFIIGDWYLLYSIFSIIMAQSILLLSESYTLRTFAQSI